MRPTRSPQPDPRIAPRPSRRHAFTLVELLVVIAIIGALIGLLLPSLNEARKVTRRTICGTNLRQVAIAVRSYANDFKNSIPYGPKAPPATAINFYPVEGNVTSLISLYTGDPVGLGLLLDTYVASQKEVLFCPDPDSPLDTEKALNAVGVGQAQGSYYYRHGSVSALSPLTTGGKKPNTQLDNLGDNRDGRRIRILAMDTQFNAPDGMVIFGIVPRSHHEKEVSNGLSVDGSVALYKNTDNRFKVDITASPYDALEQILDAFELMDGLNP